MREVAVYLAIGFGVIGLLTLSLLTVRYRVNGRFLRISWLGVPIRWVRLTNIRQIGTHRVFWAERWFNTFSPSKRYLVLRKRSGLLKHLIITPRNQFVFKAELERARDRLPAAAGNGGSSANGSQRETTVAGTPQGAMR